MPSEETLQDKRHWMISVIIKTDGDERPVVATLAPLVRGAAAGLVRDVILVERHGSASMERVADASGCHLLVHRGSNGALLSHAAQAARSDWMLFLRAGAILEGSWIDEIGQFLESASLAPRARAAIFRQTRSPHADAAVRDAIKTARRWLLGPSAEQGLLISRAHYAALGGHSVTSERAEAKLLAKLRRKDRIILRSRIAASY